LSAELLASPHLDVVDLVLQLLAMVNFHQASATFFETLIPFGEQNCHYIWSSLLGVAHMPVFQ
jgi:hypothetical protein